MATTQQQRLTSRHLATQLGLRASVIRDIIKLYPMWQLNDPDSYDRFVEAVTLLVQTRATNSAALASRYFQMYRELDLGLTAGKAALLAEPPTAREIRIAIDATAKSGVYRALTRGQTVEQAMQSGLVQVSGALSRQVLNGGRQTVIDMSKYEPRYHGWIRVSDGNPCAFCAMLLSRGPVYWSEESAGGGGAHWHDHCACTVRPYKGGDEWPALNKRMDDAWREASVEKEKDVDPYTNWRQFYEGRGKYAPQ